MASKKPDSDRPRKEGYQEEQPDRWPYPPMKREYDKPREKEQGNERPPKPDRQT
jgi:hypothetical protein